jgi:hypothetical protein
MMEPKELEDCLRIAITMTQRRLAYSNLEVMYTYNARSEHNEYYATNNQIVFNVSGLWFEEWVPRNVQMSKRQCINWILELFKSKIGAYTRAERLQRMQANPNHYRIDLLKQYFEREEVISNE